ATQHSSSGVPQRTSEASARRWRLSIPPAGDRQAPMHTCLGRALEPLFDAGAGDDRVAVAESHAGAERTVLVPERVQLCIQPANLFTDRRVVLGGEPVPELGALLAQDLDLLVDRIEGSHVR